MLSADHEYTAGRKKSGGVLAADILELTLFEKEPLTVVLVGNEQLRARLIRPAEHQHPAGGK